MRYIVCLHWLDCHFSCLCEVTDSCTESSSPLMMAYVHVMNGICYIIDYWSVGLISCSTIQYMSSFSWLPCSYNIVSTSFFRCRWKTASKELSVTSLSRSRTSCHSPNLTGLRIKSGKIHLKWVFSVSPRGLLLLPCLLWVFSLAFSLTLFCCFCMFTGSQADSTALNAVISSKIWETRFTLVLWQSYDLNEIQLTQKEAMLERAYYTESMPSHNFWTFGGPEAFISTKMFLKCSGKTSSGGQWPCFLKTN